MLKQSGNAIVWSYDGETLRAEPWGDASVRVRAVKMGKIGQHRTGRCCRPRIPRSISRRRNMRV